MPCTELCVVTPSAVLDLAVKDVVAKYGGTALISLFIGLPVAGILIVAFGHSIITSARLPVWSMSASRLWCSKA